MALRGSLLEFELPDIFQLIANDGKTGQLVLYDKDNEAFVIFSRGSIVSAGDSVMNLQTVLFRYLSDRKHFSEEELNELLYLCQGEMKHFTQELVNKGYLSKDELTVLSQMSIEDLTCSLFFWKNGRYRFDSLDNVDDYIAGGVMLSSDAVTMEAMRRLDEWARMKSAADNDTVFVRIRPSGAAQQNHPAMSPIIDPSGILLSLIDGVSSISVLCSRLFFTEYRIYETLFGLWQSNQITALKTAPFVRKTTASQKITKHLSFSGPTVRSFVAAHCVVLFLLGFGYVMNNVAFSKKNQEQQWARHALSASYAQNKIRAAALQFHSRVGVVPSDIRQLQDSGFIVSKDVSNYPLKVQNLMHSTNNCP
jgi:hypothetical protein